MYTPETAQKNVFVEKKCRRNRAAIEVKKMKDQKKSKKKKKTWTPKVTLRPSCVLLVRVRSGSGWASEVALV